MTHISGFERSQILLLPEAVDDYVGADNPVRFIDAFVDELDLSAAGFVRVAAKATGRPGYAPADLLKLYIYGYLNRVRSSRRLEMESHRNIEVIWLLRSLKPDFKTIADFRRDNRVAFRSVFREFVLLCRRLDLYGRELLAVDGTRIKAVNNKDRNFTRNSLQDFIRAADERLDDYLRRLDEGDIEEGGTGGADQDVYICPAGETLSPNHEGKSRELKKIDYSNPAACPACPLRSRCTTDRRRVSRLENEAVLDRMAARLKARPEILDRRREIVEHPFGSIKQWMNQGAFLMKGLDNVRAEFSLTALVYNLRRALNILGVEAMMAAVRG